MRLIRNVLTALFVIVGLALLPAYASALRFDDSPDSPLTVGESPDNQIDAIATGDLNGDGKDDIASVGTNNKIHVALSQEDGLGFDPAPGSPFGTDSDIDSKKYVYIGDFGGDSSPDLLAGQGALFEVFIGDGTGTFGATADSWFIPAGNSSLTYGSDPIAIGDVNHDDVPDVVIGLSAHGVLVAVGTGDGAGHFTDSTPINIPTLFNNSGDGFWYVTIGNFNGDNDPDIAMSLQTTNSASGSPTGIYVAYGAGDASFEPDPFNPVASSGSLFSRIQSVATIDLDNSDSFDDIAYSVTAEPDQVNEVRTLLGSAQGLTPNPDPKGTAAFGDDTRPTVIKAADVDGDSDQDLLTVLFGAARIGVATSDNNGGLTLAGRSQFTLPALEGTTFFANTVSAGDFNGDGFPDIASSSGHPASLFYSRAIDVLINKPDPVLTPDHAYGFPETRPGQSSAPNTFTLENQGAPPLEIDDVDITGDTGQFQWDTSDCGDHLDSGQSCDVVGKFKPVAHGNFSSTVLFTFDDDFAAFVASGDTGTDATIDPASGSFGEVISGYEPDYKTVTFTIKSVGSWFLHLADPQITGPDAQYFSVVDPHSCDALMGAGISGEPVPSCQIQIRFAPTGDIGGFLEAQLSFGENNDPDPFEINLGGFARRAEYTITPTSNDFGEADIGTLADREEKVFTLTSTGAGKLPIAGASLSGTDAASFRISSNDCPAMLSPGDACDIKVIFDPISGAAGSRNAALDVDAFSSTTDPPSIALTGTAVIPPAPKLSIKLKAPKKAKAGKKAVVKVTVRNSGTAASGPFTLQASAPAKLTGKVKDIRSQPMGRGKSITKTFRIPVKKTAKGRFKVKVKLIPQGKTKPLLTTSTPFISVWGSTNKPG